MEFREGRCGAGVGRVGGGGGPRGGGVRGAIRGVCVGGGEAPLTSPCRPSDHTITINLTRTFAASYFGHPRHVDWAEQNPPNSVRGCFCHVIALLLELQHSHVWGVVMRHQQKGVPVGGFLSALEPTWG